MLADAREGQNSTLTGASASVGRETLEAISGGAGGLPLDQLREVPSNPFSSRPV